MAPFPSFADGLIENEVAGQLQNRQGVNSGQHVISMMPNAVRQGFAGFTGKGFRMSKKRNRKKAAM